MIQSGSLVAIVDDDARYLRALERLLQAAGLKPLCYGSAGALLADRPRLAIDCLILDVRLGALTGFDVVRRLAADQFNVPVIFMTAHDDPAARKQALALGAVGYLRKPFSADSLFQAIQQAVPKTPAVPVLETVPAVSHSHSTAPLNKSPNPNQIKIERKV